jgi:hypothetical protein
MADAHSDLFAPPPADAARLPGTIDGPSGWSEGLLAGLRAWCGPVAGWRDVGELLGAGVGCVGFQHGRLILSLTFDLGPHSIPRRPREEPEDEDAG